MANFPAEKVQQYKDSYGQHANIRDFAKAIASDRAAHGQSSVPDQMIRDMYLSVHPDRKGEEDTEEKGMPVDTASAVLRDTAMAVPAIAGGMAAGAGAGAAGLGYAGTALARMAGAGLANMGAGAAARKYQGAPQAPVQDLAMGAGGEAIGMGTSGVLGGLKGAWNGMGKGVPFLPAVGTGATDALKAYLRPFGTPVAPNKSSMVAPENLAAVKNLPDYDVRSIALQHPNVGDPAKVAPNIVPNLTAKGANARAAGLSALDDVSGNLAASRQYHTTQQASAREQASFDADSAGASLAAITKKAQDAVGRSAQVTVAGRPQLPVKENPIFQPATVQPAPVLDPPQVRAPPQPPVPDVAQAPTAADASGIARTRSTLGDYVSDNGTRPVPSGVVDPRSPGAANLQEAVTNHGGKEIADGISLPEGPQSLEEIQRRPPFVWAPPDEIGRAVDMNQTMPIMETAKGIGAYLKGQTGRAPNFTPVSGETQVPLGEGGVLKASKDPSAFRSTGEDPLAVHLKGQADQAVAAPKQRQADAQWTADREREQFTADQQQASQDHSVADRRANNQAAADEANASNSAKVQHDEAQAQAEKDFASRSASALRKHDLTQPQAGSRRLTPQELASSYQNPSVLEGASTSPSARAFDIARRGREGMVDDALERVVSTHRDHANADSALADRGLSASYQPKGAGIDAEDWGIQSPEAIQTRNRAYNEADVGIARLKGGQSVKTGEDGVPQIQGSREDALHPILKKAYNSVMDKLFRHESGAVTDSMATPRLLDLANQSENGGIFSGVKSDVNEPLMPTLFHGSARAAGGLAADVAGQTATRVGPLADLLREYTNNSSKKRTTP